MRGPLSHAVLVIFQFTAERPHPPATSSSTNALIAVMLTTTMHMETTATGPHLTRTMSLPAVQDHPRRRKISAFSITAPTVSSTWQRGRPAIIQWEPVDHAAIAEVRIVLLRTNHPNGCAILADHVENNGLFVLTNVPGSLPPAADYFLRIVSMDGQHGADSNCFAIRP
ncbi:Aste57867_21802 [Aphanomyces stellatus]|uniref:Aste57867_21802 protein n=1 Tax=Aphanomyces stellatus TaxID=120398 RepID=A0A485LIG6_9STRA|nr:hypothetical protein As57867_021733 [Aphanomyces stellatus]VFT98471.1 Aste57867_21802 [Aphanomyces stellatus]